LGRYTPWNSHSHGLIWENLWLKSLILFG
jgi:hypothetical protein